MIQNSGNLRRRTEENLERVRNLVSIYEVRGTDEKARGKHETDLLRAAVVLLHAALEDFVRSLVAWRLPISDPETIKKSKLHVPLEQLLSKRDQSVDSIVLETIDELLSHRTYNSKDDVATALKSIGIETSGLKVADLAVAMMRRHKIVHRADRASENESARVNPIQADHVKKWISNVDEFTRIVLEKLGGEDVSYE